MDLSSLVFSSIHWTFAIVLVLAIVIVASSLAVYSSHTVPVFSLFSHPVQERESSILLEMIHDRRLISTLVAAQASVFCPLFLLLSGQEAQKKAGMDLLCCHILMPLGLALSWIFCILFDRKTMVALPNQHADPSWYDYLWPQQDMCLFDRGRDGGEWTCIVVNLIHGLKYVMVAILLLEVGLVLAGLLVRVYWQRTGAIRLPNNDEKDHANVSMMQQV